jgi:hypothetical protein
MVAGNNLKVRIFRINYSSDNEVGGAVVTGTYIGDYPARLYQVPEEQLLLQQGLETERIFRLTMSPGYIDVNERDEIEIIAPTDNVYYGQRFRVRSVTYPVMNKRDPRSYMLLTLSRSTSAHVRQ